MSYTYFVGESQVTLFNLSNGSNVVFHAEHPSYAKAVAFIQAGDYAAAEALDVKATVNTFASASSSSAFKISIKNGVGTVDVGGVVYPLSDVLVDRINQLSADGYPTAPLERFIENLYKNVSKTAIDELFLFLDSAKLPITEDGCFIAYKIVRNDYKDIYTGKMDNSVGKVLEMPRFAVDDKRHHTCSAGLHFCSKGYLTSYSSHDRYTDRCVLVKINPADVVSIPSDYNNAKGRTCRYEVVGEVTDSNWRNNLSVSDYTPNAVVNKTGDTYTKPVQHVTVTSTDGYDFNAVTGRWFIVGKGNMVSRSVVAAARGITVAELMQEEV